MCSVFNSVGFMSVLSPYLATSTIIYVQSILVLSCILEHQCL